MKKIRKPNKQVGVWIDHRQAILVLLSPGGEEIQRLDSNVEKQLRRSEQPPYEPSYESHEKLKTPADDEQQRAYTEHLTRYYDRVIAAVGTADSVLVLGPGEAKGELKKRFEARSTGVRTLDVQTAGDLTVPQLVQEVRRHFPSLE